MTGSNRVACPRENGCAPGVPFTRAVTLRPVAQVLNDAGASADAHLAAARIDPDVLDRPETPVPLFFAIAFVDRAARVEGIADLGLLAADRLNGFTGLGAFGTRLSRAPSAVGYLCEGARLVPRLTSGARYGLRRRRGELRFHIAQPHARTEQSAHAELYAVLATIRTLEAFAACPWRPASLRVPPWCRIGPEGRDRLAIDRIERDGDDFSFPVEPWLLPRANPCLDRAHVASPALPPHPSGLAAGVSAVLDGLHAFGDGTIALAAEAAGSSVRTLQRRLQAEKTSFARLQHERRLRRATRLLLATGEPVTEIAIALGYEDAANFTRAFRSYAGCSPTAFRSANAAPHGDIAARQRATARVGETSRA